MILISDVTLVWILTVFFCLSTFVFLGVLLLFLSSAGETIRNSISRMFSSDVLQGGFERRDINRILRNKIGRKGE